MSEILEGVGLDRATRAELVRRGIDPATATEAQFLEAMQAPSVRAEEDGDVLRDVLIERGAAPAGDTETVTEAVLRTRAVELLGEDGFTVTGLLGEEAFTVKGGGGRRPEEADLRRAYGAAIDELGLPGQRRKDLPQRQAASRDELIVAAVADGRIVTAAQEDEYRQLMDDEPNVAAAILARAEPHPLAVLTGLSVRGMALDESVTACLQAMGVAEDNVDENVYVRLAAAAERAAGGADDVYVGADLVQAVEAAFQRRGVVNASGEVWLAEIDHQSAILGVLRADAEGPAAA